MLVVELQKGHTNNVVVGQIQRYMGFAQYELAEVNQTVKGVTIGLESDLRLRHALSIIPSIKFYLYEMNFKCIQPNS